MICRFSQLSGGSNKVVMTSLQLYKYLLRQCERLPPDACKYYKFSIKQSYKQHKVEPDPERVKEMVAKSIEDAKWIVNKDILNMSVSAFGEKIEDYEIFEHLGKGGFAHVYRAKCRKSNIFVAIKMIDKASMASAGMIGRVRQEVTIHSRLKHPAILELYTFFEDVHYVYLVLELAHNGELARHFKLSNRGLSEKAAADIFRQVVSGVLYLHSHNIIHRDLSLNNLLLTKDQNVKIADFGLATQLNGPDEKHVTMCGTPNYISPEVASRELHGLPADVWGLGCLLYTLFVGSPPFHTQHVKTTLNKVIQADYKIPTEVSIQAQDILQRLLCKDPTKRITLKEIIEHPFVSQTATAPCIHRQDFSRDSGFITTLHSTQHSSKARNEDKIGSDYLGMCRDLNTPASINKDVRLAPMNVFSGMQENLSAHSNGYNFRVCGGNENILSNHISVKNENQLGNDFAQKLGIASNGSGTSFLDNIRKKDKIPENEIGFQTADENKENMPKACKVSSNVLSVPPLCADRLPVISHKTRNAILKIEATGVIVEFIKRKGKEREEKVVEICKISKDGMKIIIYLIDSNRDKPNLNLEHDPKADEIFTYHNLPQKHWKKYLYASRFVDLVKAKTPKITLYSSLAKCQLMENGTDIELFFYNGEKVTYNSAEGLKIIDKNLKTHHNSGASPELKHLNDHFEDCSNRMKRIQDALSCISDECFPLIIGKRPSQSVVNVASPCQGSVNVNFSTPNWNLGSFHRTAASSTQVPSDYNMK